MPKTIECPVCHEPVGNDPHEKCLEAVKALQVEDETPLPPMPCPACSKPMVEGTCPDPTCEIHQ